jgi:hypothetical protein
MIEKFSGVLDVVAAYCYASILIVMFFLFVNI